ncbi:unnamed protein product [Haemonchus placei]|uniref:Uncharacterized protein n=1 Tax=Haemonchus placei TaxID=6290 RepID=A0A0N4WZC2_HAEPC|nr:unnamed protein product [Haemonchus placei]
MTTRRRQTRVDVGRASRPSTTSTTANLATLRCRSGFDDLDVQMEIAQDNYRPEGDYGGAKWSEVVR